MMKTRVCFAMCMLIIACRAHAQEQRGLTIPMIQDSTGQQVSLYQHSYALVIGVSDYTAGWPDLPGVTKDVQAVQSALKDQGFEVSLVENPTRETLEQAFAAFIQQYGQQPDNRLLFYFAGHGHTLKLAYGGEMGYIVPVDAPNPNQDQTGFLAKALDMQMLEVYAKRIQSKHALFLFDSCFSGSIFALSRAVPENISYKTAQPVRQFITSGSAEEQVPDESVFRQQFIAALQGEADANGDGYVTGAELGEFLQGQVVNYSKGAQHPQYGKIRDPYLDKGDFVFVLPGGTYVENVQVGSAPAPSVDPEVEMWELVKNSDNIADIKAFLEAFPQGRLAKVAQVKLAQIDRQQQPSPPVAAPDTQPPRFRFFADFENGLQGFNEEYEAWGGKLEVLADPTGSGKGNVLKGTVTTEEPEDDEYYVTPEKNFPFQATPCRIQEDIWMSQKIYDDILDGNAEWYTLITMADVADWKNDRWHSAFTVDIWDDGYLYLAILGEEGADDEYFEPDLLPDAPEFMPETWHTIRVDVDASGMIFLFQDDQLVTQGKLRPPSRNGFEYGHVGPISAAGSLSKGGYVLVDNFSIVCGP